MKENQGRAPLVDALKAYQKDRPAYFCIPGHRFERGISRRWLTPEECSFLQYDLTEVDGLDDLHQPSGVIKEAQELMAQLYCAKKSYFLVNGTTCGNEAMLLASLKERDQVLVPRNVHKSVMEGLILCGAEPIYFMPEWSGGNGISGGISPESVEKALAEHPMIKAVFLVNPTYYGVFSDIRQIADICHRRNAVLLVDEAHGGHVYFSDRLPQGSISCDADMCSQSFHKVTGSLTQSSVLHLLSDRVSQMRVEHALKLVQSTSPSYLLMASLDAARYELARDGSGMMDKALELANAAREKINQIPGMHCLKREEVTGKNSVFDLDETRLVISCDRMSGYDLQKVLRRQHGVETELGDSKNVLAIVTYANTWEEIAALISGLEKISADFMFHDYQYTEIPMPQIPEMVLSPRKAFFSDTTTIPWNDAVGEIAGELIAPYPPGIPLVVPGERLTADIFACVEAYRSFGCHFHGPEDEDLLTFKIIENDL